MVPVGQRCCQRGGLVEDVVDGGALPGTQMIEEAMLLTLSGSNVWKAGETRRAESVEIQGRDGCARAWDRGTRRQPLTAVTAAVSSRYRSPIRLR